MKMQFGSFEWTQKPETLTVSFQRSVQMLPDNQGGWITVDTGLMGRVISGEGCFVGEGAYGAFSGLVEQFNKGVAASLTLDHWPAMWAKLTELSVTEEPCENYVSYRFRFMECPREA